jgi:hypothetical protein
VAALALLTVDGYAQLTLNVDVENTGSVTNNGPVTINLDEGAGEKVNVNGGPVNINGGNLVVNGGETNLEGGPLNVNGGQVNVNGGNLVIDSGSISVINGGTVNIGDSLKINEDGNGSVVIENGSLAVTNSPATFTSTSGGTLIVNGGVTGNVLDVTGNVGVTGGLGVIGNVAVWGNTFTTGTTFTSGVVSNNIFNTGHIQTTSLGAAVVGAGTVYAGTMNSFVSNSVYSNVGLLNAGFVATHGLAVAPYSYVNMGNNVVHGVADPIHDLDAANKRYVDTGLSEAFKEIDRNTQGIAIAMAMTGLMLPDAKKFALGANIGFFEDKQAIAVQGAVRISPNVILNGGIGTGFQDSSTVGGRVGVQAAW